jgi:hypothetical protein
MDQEFPKLSSGDESWKIASIDKSLGLSMFLAALESEQLLIVEFISKIMDTACRCRASGYNPL